MQEREAEKEPREDVAEMLARLRLEHDWSQPVLARRAGVGLATIARIENRQVNKRTGKVDVPKPTTLKKIARALGDGNAERARDARLQLFAAAGHGEDEEPGPPMDAAQEIARLRARVEALERKGTADPADIEREIQRLLAAYPDDKRAAALSLMRQALERYGRDPQR